MNENEIKDKNVFIGGYRMSQLVSVFQLDILGTVFIWFGGETTSFVLIDVL